MADIVIDCGETLGIADISEFYEKLLNAVAEGHIVHVDVSHIEYIDGAALQVMYAYSKYMRSQGHDLVWESPSDNFLRNVQLLGMLPAIKIDGNTAGKVTVKENLA